MMLRDSFGLYEDAERIEYAVEASLAAGIFNKRYRRTGFNHKEMTEAIIERL